MSGGNSIRELKDGILVITSMGGEYTFTYDYAFSNNDNTLTLTDAGLGI